ncbi:protein MKS1-like [Phalaenopsis equestris]|uniref:protein MKS1-like n=1 Tax=Phalaenopsis equestris TaxID=78828 RepID=UPI0009E2D87A|nr:protein MKS1-like [Phalaenopsis equestris]
MDSGQPAPQRPPSHLDLSPRRQLQLQGPRPSPLRVSKESHKIKKPPLPPPQLDPPPIAPSQDSREPIIIYTISPKVIHVEPSNFMDLVQRLTGPRFPDPQTPPAETLSPAAKLATIHRTIQSPGADRPASSSSVADLDVLNDLSTDRCCYIPGILSPVPANLPPISPAFFSPSYIDSSFQNFLHDLSPAGFQVGRSSPGGSIAGGVGVGGGNFWNSSGNFFSPSVVPSPGVAAWDLFNQFQDF